MVGIDDGGLVSVLEQMARSFVFPIEVNRIPGHQAPHEFGKISRTAVIKKMKMIRQKRPCEAIGTEAIDIPKYSSAQFRPVRIVREDVSLLDSPRINVVEGTGEIDTRSSRHFADQCNRRAAKGYVARRGKY
jgi:hypothetical protein